LTADASISTSSGLPPGIGFLVEPYPFGLLTIIVSLEAIFLSTFVMISVNLADRKRQVLADRQWQTVQQEEAAERGATSPTRSWNAPRPSTP
jgi:uncharacterized membrane protein